MKILFRQQGGAMPPYLAYNPFVPQSTGTVQTTTQTTQTTKSSDSNELKDKDLLNMLKEIDGLPNDMQIVISNIQNMYQLQSLVPNSSTNKSLVNMYLGALYKTKVAGYNKKEYDNAYQIVKNNKGLSEFAITDNGSLVVQNRETGQFSTINIQEYLANPEAFNSSVSKYAVQTNSNLLYWRAHSKNQAFNNGVFSIVENGIGLEKVAELVNSNLNNLGKSETSKPFSIYSQDGQIVAGADILKELQKQGVNTTLDGLYEGKVISETQREQASAALNYLYSILPKNAQTLLQIKAVQNGLGDANNPQQAAKALLGQLIMSKESTKFNIELDFKGAYNIDGSKKSDSDGKSDFDKINYNAAGQFVMGVGYASQFTFQDGTNDGATVYSTEMPVTKNNQPIGRSTIQDLTTSDFSGVLDFNNVTMGGLTISPTGLSRVITDDGAAHSIDMVIDTKALQSGVIKPDLRYFKKKEQADNYIRENNIDAKNYEAVNKVYQQYGLPVKYTEDGKLNVQAYARFAVFNGEATNTAFSTTQDSDITFNDYLRELTDQEEANVIADLKKIDSKFSYDSKSWWDSISPFWNEHDSIYKGTIWIPVKAHMLNAMASQSAGLSSNQINTLDALEQAKSRTSELQQKYKNGNDWK